jgi:hypothetical protein
MRRNEARSLRREECSSASPRGLVCGAFRVDDTVMIVYLSVRDPSFVQKRWLMMIFEAEDGEDSGSERIEDCCKKQMPRLYRKEGSFSTVGVESVRASCLLLLPVDDACLLP